MLLIIVPLMVVPMLTLAIVSFLAARSSLLMCLCGISYTTVSCWPRRSEFVQFSKDGMLVPRLANGWRWLDDRTLEMTLRQGVQFHNGEVFDAEIVKLNWDENTRVHQPFRAGQFLTFKPGSLLEILDLYTVRFHFPEPDGTALVKLSSMHMGNRQFYRDVGWGTEHW